MKVQSHQPFVSTLPGNDTHPYRTGAWRPQSTEYDAWDLDVEGKIPEELAGVYIRNTENPLMPAIGRYHPFDGDGMLHSISFAGGEAQYHNRFVRTAGLLAEQAAGGPLWAGLAESPRKSIADYGWGARPLLKDASSTDIVVHRGVALSSHYQCGDLYRLDPITLAADGVETWGGKFPAEGVSAHTKVDEATGELLFFNYSLEAPFMKYGVVDGGGELAHYIDIPLPGPRLPHDMCFTENYAILNDFPLFWALGAMDAGYYVPVMHADLPTRLAVVPRRGSTSDIIWFEADPTYVLHWINAYEDGDEIVLDGFFQEEPTPTPEAGDDLEKAMFRYLDLHRMRSRAHRWRLNLTTGRCTEERLSDTTMEFGMINQRVAGRPHRYSYNALPVQGWFGFQGLIKHDIVAGTETTHRLPNGVFNSETVMAPRPGGTAEDDGWLITFTMDVVKDESRCLVFEAQDPGAGPVASIKLPERISSGTHATWAPAEALAGSTAT
jgi:carotenoid cleavage dioxygenase